MIKQMRYLIWLTAVLFLISCGDGNEDTSGDSAEHTAIPVEIMTVESQVLKDVIHATGAVDANYDANVSAETSGRATAIVNDIGSQVASGDVIVTLDDAAQKLEFQKSSAQLDIAEAAHVKAKADLDRMEELFLTGDISKSEIEQARLLTTKARGEHELAQAVYGLAEKSLFDTRIKAPFSGEITSVYANVGEMIAVGQVVFTIVQIDTAKIRIAVSADDVGMLNVGQPSDINIRPLGEGLLSGIVSLIGIKASDVTRTYPVEVLVPNMDGNIKPGMIADVSIIVNQRDGAILVPRSAILQRNGRTVAFVEDEGVARERLVSVSSELAESIVISSGLAAGDRLIIVGQNGLQDGYKVIVTN